MLAILATPHPDPGHAVDRTAPFLWYTLCVNSAAQKWVCERAKELEIETYVPMSRTPPAPRVLRLKLSPEPVTRPLMPGYVFVSLPTAASRFDLFQPFDRECDRPAPLPPDAAAGYVADYAQPQLEPIWGCRGFLSGTDGPMPVHEAVIASIRMRERNGEFDLTGLSLDGKHFVPKWVKCGAPVLFVGGPLSVWTVFGKVVGALTGKLVEVKYMMLGREHTDSVPLDWIEWRGRGL